MKTIFCLTFFIKLLFFWSYFADIKVAVELGFMTNCLATGLLIIFLYSFIRNIYLRNTFFVLTAFGFSMILLANSIYFKYFNFPITIEMITIADQLFEIKASVSDSLKIGYLLFFLPDLLVVVYLFSKSFRQRIEVTDSHFFSVSRKKLLLVIIVLQTVTVVRFYQIDYFATDQRYHPFVKFMLINPVNYYAIQLAEHAMAYLFPEKLSEEKISELKTFFKQMNEKTKSARLEVPLEEGASMPQNPNLLVVQWESLKSHAVDKMIDGKPVAPVLNRLIKEGVYFPNLYSQAYFTCGSDLGTLASLVGLKEILPSFFYNNSFTATPKLLARRGYETIVINGSKRSFWNHDRFFASLGFTRFDALEDFENPLYIGVGVSDADIYKKSFQILNGLKKPWFIYIMTLSSHNPFNFPQIPRIEAGSGSKQMDHYYSTIAYADRCLGEFLDRMERSGLMKNTVLIVYGDHTIRMEQNYDEIRKKFPDPASVRDDVIHILDSKTPLIIHAPGLLKPGVNEKICGQVDISPTMLHLASITSETMFLGENLFSKDLSGWTVDRYGVGISRDGISYGENSSRDNFKHLIDPKTGSVKEAPPGLMPLFKRKKVSDIVLKFNLNFYKD